MYINNTSVSLDFALSGLKLGSKATTVYKVDQAPGIFRYLIMFRHVNCKKSVESYLSLVPLELYLIIEFANTHY